MTRMNPDPNVPPTGSPNVNVSAWATSPVDRVRWGAVIAGIFAASSLLVLLFVLGAAIGLSAYSPGEGDQARNFAIGAGWWAAISALIAFFFGGWVAARTAVVRGSSNGLLNGAMVWAVTVPLSIVLFTGGLASMLGTAANVGSNVTANPQVSSAAQQHQGDLGARAQQAASQLQEQMTPQNLQQASSTGAKAAWGTLVSLILGLIAASLGGWLGARQYHAGEERWTSGTMPKTAEGM